MRHFKSYLSQLKGKNPFYYNILSLIGGTAGAQIILLIATPFITRLYTPDEFGVLSLFTSILSIIAVIASLKYDLAIPLPKYDKQASTIVRLSLVILFYICILITLSIVIFTIFRERPFPLNNYQLYLLPIALALIGIYQILTYWAIRKKEFPEIAKTKLSQAIGSVTIQLSLFKFGAITLIIGQIISQTIGILALLKVAKKTNLNIIHSRKKTLTALIKYKKFPLIESITALLNVTGSKLPILLLSIFFNVKTAGLYALAEKILYMPVSLISSSFSNVFFSEAPIALREGWLNKLIERIYQQLTTIALPPIILIMLIGPKIFELIFGDNWKEVGEFARWMAPWLCLVFITTPISTLFIILNKQQQGFIFQIIMLFVRFISIYTGYLFYNAKLAIILFSASSTIIWTLTLFYFFIQNNVRVLKNILYFISNTLISLLTCIPTIAILYFDKNNLLSLIISSSITIALIMLRYRSYIKGKM